MHVNDEVSGCFDEEDFLFYLTLQCKHLNNDPPNGLHRHCDEADNGVGESEVENQEVNIRATLHPVPAIYYRFRLIHILLCLQCDENG